MVWMRTAKPSSAAPSTMVRMRSGSVTGAPHSPSCAALEYGSESQAVWVDDTPSKNCLRPGERSRSLVGELVAQLPGASQILQRGGEHVDAHGEVAALVQRAVHVVAHEVAAGYGQKRHVAHAGDALGVEVGQELPDAGVRFLLAEFEHGWDERGGRRFLDDPRQLAVFVLLVDAAGGRDRVLRDAELLEALRVHPQRVRVARLQAHGRSG